MLISIAGQLSLLSAAEWKMSTVQSHSMLCGWEVEELNCVWLK